MTTTALPRLGDYGDGHTVIESRNIRMTVRQRDGIIRWMSDWGRWPELEAAGVVETVDRGGPYGHTDLRWTGC